MRDIYHAAIAMAQSYRLHRRIFTDNGKSSKL